MTGWTRPPERSFRPSPHEANGLRQGGGTTIIALEGTPGKAYEARGWELWAPLAPLYEAGEYARSPIA